MNIFLTVTGILLALVVIFGALSYALFQKNKALNRRLIGVKAELNGVLKRIKNQAEVAKMPEEKINENLTEYFRD